MSGYSKYISTLGNFKFQFNTNLLQLRDRISEAFFLCYKFYIRVNLNASLFHDCK